MNKNGLGQLFNKSYQIKEDEGSSKLSKSIKKIENE